MMRAGPWKPWYVWRPQQLAVRLWRSCRQTPAGYRPIPVAWGGSIEANPITTVGRSLWTTAVHDLTMSEALTRLAEPGGVVVDAGAHVGYMTVLAAIATGDRGTVLAFEPHPDLFAVLQRNVEAAKAAGAEARIVVKNAALGAIAADAALVMPEGFDTNDGIAQISGTGSAGSVPVRMDTVDAVVKELQLPRIDVLKVDVEGHELGVFQGAATALAQHSIRHILYEDFEGRRSAATRFLESFGYRVCSIGWSMRGLNVTTKTGGSLARDYEAPAYLATLNEEDALSRCSTPGWNVLRKGLGRPCASHN